MIKLNHTTPKKRVFSRVLTARTGIEPISKTPKALILLGFFDFFMIKRD